MMRPAPRIGIAIGRETHDGRLFEATPHEYVSAILGVGGIPLLLPPLPAAMAVDAVERLDGLLLTGGGDVSPSCYGATLEPETAGVDDERDASELALVRACQERNLPILGICRGAQLLNVAFGGTLHQHLVPEHRQGRRRYEEVHQVDLDPHCRLAALIGQQSFGVNSIHHQGIELVGSALTAVGFSYDGLPELLECRDHRLMAVQWHPECLPCAPASRALFLWLVAEAKAVEG